jgi:hypothetical protein
MTELIALDDKSKVWIYQADRFFTDDEMDEIIPAIKDFVTHWVSHSNQLRAYGNLFHHRFICLFVDESANASASGCSIDSSVRFIKEIGTKYKTDMMGRTSFCYLHEDVVKAIDMNDLASAYANNEIDNSTLFFDNNVKTKEEFLQSWVKQLQDSWHKRFI